MNGNADVESAGQFTAAMIAMSDAAKKMTEERCGKNAQD